jgi:multiple sugar transport system permease protein
VTGLHITQGDDMTQTMNTAHKVPFKVKAQKTLKSLASHGLINLVGLFFLIPFLWMLLTSLKSDRDISHTPPRLLPYDYVYVTVNGQQLPLYNVTTPEGVKKLAAVKIEEGVGTFVDPADPSQTIRVKLQQGGQKMATALEHISFRWQNYPDAMSRGSRPSVGASFWVYLKNSLIIAFFCILGTLLSNAPVAYAFARIKFPGRDFLFVFVLATMMLPYQVTMIPLYLLFNNVLHWGDSFLPIIVPAFFANAYDVFLLRQFFRTIPEEMCDAARVDGASEWQIFTQIVIPLSVPVLATVTVFTFLWAWNDFTGPLLFLTSPRNFTMALGLQDFQGQRTMVWNQMMAAAVVFTIPIIIAFFFAQKTFIQGIKLTGSKE